MPQDRGGGVRLVYTDCALISRRLLADPERRELRHRAERVTKVQASASSVRQSLCNWIRVEFQLRFELI